MSSKRVGSYEVDEHGIYQIIDINSHYGSYDAKLVLPKEVFVAAYEMYIKQGETDGENREQET